MTDDEMKNLLLYPAGPLGLADLDWQFTALLCVITFSDLVVYRRHVSPAAIFIGGQRALCELQQQLSRVRPPHVL
jgi:hypothetical protein